jgi:hypothetical protein
MIDLLILSILCGFTSWRIASLLHTEDIFERLRRWIGIDNNEDGYPAIYPDNTLGKIFNCFWCLSTIVALPITALLIWWAAVDWVWALPVWLSASTIAIWTEKQILRAQSR